MISHVTMEVDAAMIDAEVEFWRVLGYSGPQRTRRDGATRWLRSRIGGRVEGLATSWIHLIPVPGSELPRSGLGVGGSGHVAVVLGSQFERTVERLDGRVPMIGVADHWGSRRVFVQSPSGWRVEVLEEHPAASWPGPPDPD